MLPGNLCCCHCVQVTPGYPVSDEGTKAPSFLRRGGDLTDLFTPSESKKLNEHRRHRKPVLPVRVRRVYVLFFGHVNKNGIKKIYLAEVNSPLRGDALVGELRLQRVHLAVQAGHRGLRLQQLLLQPLVLLWGHRTQDRRTQDT